MVEPIRPPLRTTQPQIPSVMSRDIAEAVSRSIRNSPESRTARAADLTARETARSADLIHELVKGNEAQEAREAKMLRWTVAGVALSAVAAITGIAALVIALAG